MQRLFIPLIAILLAAGVPPALADSPVTTGTALAGYAPDVPKYLATLPAEKQGYVSQFPDIVQKNVAAMHQIQSLSVEIAGYAPDQTPGEGKPDDTYRVDWQKPDKARVQRFHHGMLMGEQMVDGTHRWQWFSAYPTPQNPAPAAEYRKTDVPQLNVPKGFVAQHADIGGLFDPSVGTILQPNGLLMLGPLTDQGEVVSPGAGTVHRVSISAGKSGGMNAVTHQMEMVDNTVSFDLDPASGLPLQMKTTGQQTLVYSHYRINPTLPAALFTIQRPEQYLYYPQPAFPIRPGQQALDFTLNGSDGKPVSLSGFRGRPVLLCFIQPLYPGSFDLAEPLEQLNHYIDIKAVTTAMVADYAPSGEGLGDAEQKQLPGWIASHPFLTKLWIVDTGKGFGDKIRANVRYQYGLSPPSVVLIDKDGKVAAVYCSAFRSGKTCLLSLGKTEAEDTALKAPSAINSALAADIAALSAK